jgi:small subunit ribosomal protein S14
MAKLNMKARDLKRKKLSGNPFVRAVRAALKKVVVDLSKPYDERMDAVAKLSQRDRNESPCRCRNRCRFCGRSRGVYRKFGLCRIHLREAMMRGDVPGMVKASW